MESNISAIVEYFESGIKGPDEIGRLGVELEHFVTDNHSNPIPYSDEHGSRWILEQYRDELDSPSYGEDDALIGVSAPGASLTLEPAAGEGESRRNGADTEETLSVHGCALPDHRPVRTLHDAGKRGDANLHRLFLGAGLPA